MTIDNMIFIMEILGTVAFASSGALTAIHRNMDLLGVNVLAVITAVGGGIIRDTIIGKTPPQAFISPVFVLISVITATVLFLIVCITGRLRSEKADDKATEIYNLIMTIFDTLGLAIFTVSGIISGLKAGFEDYFLLGFLGVITGVGGGVLRDVMANQRPYIFVKHVYASASLVGAVVFLLVNELNFTAAVFAGFLSVVIIRVLAIKFRWNLPRADRFISHEHKG